MRMTSGNQYIEQEKIQEVLDRVNIVEIVSNFVNLKRAGTNYKGLCPFHSEKTPSFVVSEDKQMFHCFGCGAGGNAIKFLMEIEQKTFPEALRELAEKNGVLLEEKIALTPEQERKKKTRERFLYINCLAADFFQNQLHHTPEGRKAMEYLTDRGLEPDTIGNFRLGWAPDDWQSLKEYLTGKKISPEEMLQLGLLSINESGSRTFDKFRGRIIFPIQDLQGEVVAFGGRIIGPGEPKYLNSPETPVYHKGHYLYALHLARQEIRKADYSLLVEGYMDVLICHQFGLKNAVASLGTAFTEQQARLLMRYSNQAYFAYDGDTAGIRAAVRGMEIMQSLGIKAMGIRFPSGMDPDDYLRAEGKAGFQDLLRTAEHPVLFKLLFLMPEEPGSLQEKHRLLEEIAEDIFLVKSTLVRDDLLKKISEKLRLPEDAVRTELRFLYTRRKRNRNQAGPAHAQGESREAVPVNVLTVNPDQFFILKMLHERKDLVKIVEKRGGALLFDQPQRQVYEAFTSEEKYSTIKNLSNDHEKLISCILLQEDHYPDKERAFMEILNNLSCKWLEAEYGARQKELSMLEKEGDPQIIQQLLQEMNGLIKQKDQIRKGIL